MPRGQPSDRGLRTAPGTWDRVSGPVMMKTVYPDPSVSLEEEPGLAACPPSLSCQQPALVSGRSMPDQMAFKCKGCQKENGSKILLLNEEENNERLLKCISKGSRTNVWTAGLPIPPMRLRGHCGPRLHPETFLKTPNL